MKYVAPVADPAEVEALVAAGADELYCGYLSREWRACYGDHESVSRRQGPANVMEEALFEALIAEARCAGTPLYLTVNGRYTEPQLDSLVGLCQRFEELGGTGLQICDLGLLARLAGRTNLRLCLSLLANAQNIPTLEFYRGFGIDRVVFPRFLEPECVGELLAAFPGLEGEFMALFDKCPFIDGYCRFYHGNVYLDASERPLAVLPDATGSPAPCRIAQVGGEGVARVRERAPSPTDLHEEDATGSLAPCRITSFDTTYTTHSCIALLGEPPNFFACAACALQDFEAAGADFAKIGGRGTPLAHRILGLRFLRAAADRASHAERQQLYHEIWGSACNCYFGARP